MSNKPASSPARSRSSVDNALLRVELRSLIEHYLDIRHETLLEYENLPAEDRSILARGSSELLISFSGTLRRDSELTHYELDKELSELDLYPLLRNNPGGDEDAEHLIHIAAQRPPKPADLPVWPNILLFIATIISVLLTGASIALAQIRYEERTQQPAPIVQDISEAEIAFGGQLREIIANIWRGWPYALGILLILVPHEMGHYLMMRRHNTAATWPYFLPAFLISPFGTFGAAIMLRETLKNRKTLLDVGAAGPLAGFIVAIPVLFIGLATSLKVPVAATGIVEGNSLLYAFAKWLVFGEWLPNANYDVLVNQLAWAGWTGLFVTALNMLPLGQLDGGHVLYSLFGDRARKLFWPLLGVMGILALFVSPTWLFFTLLLLLVGRFYAVPLDTITRLDSRRRVLAIVALAVFVLSFTPVPIYQRGEIGGLLSNFSLIQAGTLAVVALLTVPRILKLRIMSDG